MTARPRNAGDPQGWAIPDSDVADEDTDVLALAGRQPRWVPTPFPALPAQVNLGE